MSKMDELRAMREARYAQQTARDTKPVAPKRRPAAETAEKPSIAATTEVDRAPQEPGLCGHRAISGRTCTREHGHAAKSHRYS